MRQTYFNKKILKKVINNEFFKRSIFIIKNDKFLIFISSFLLTAIVFLSIYIESIYNLKNILDQYYSEINTLINEDDGKIYETLDTKISSIFYDKIQKDKSFSFEIYACPKYYQSYSCTYQNPILFKNNTPIIFAKLNYFKLNFLRSNLYIGKYPIISVKINSTFNNVNFDIYLYKCPFSITNFNIITFFILIYCISFVLIFVLLYAIGKYKYLNLVSSTIQLIKHEFQSLTNIIFEPTFPKEIRRLLSEKIKRISQSLFEFNEKNYVDQILLQDMFNHIRSCKPENYIYIHKFKVNNRYYIPVKHLNIAIINVIENAFSPPSNSSEVNIYVEESPSNDKLLIRVINDGNPIPEYILKKFGKEPFSYGKKDGKGYAIFQIAAMLSKFKSNIDVPKSDDTETEILIEINCADKKYKNKPLVKNIPSIKKGKSIQKIILIEDEYTYVEMIKQRFENFYSIHICSTPEEFFQKLEQNFFGDINNYNIISDYYFGGGLKSPKTYDTTALYNVLQKVGFQNKVVVFSSADQAKTKFDFFARKNSAGLEDIANFLE